MIACLSLIVIVLVLKKKNPFTKMFYYFKKEKILVKLSSHNNSARIFSERLHSNFPGLRGLHKFNYNRKIGKKLSNILNNQDVFTQPADPFWWKSKAGDMYIRKFIVSNKKCLLDIYELIIKCVYVYTSVYWREFIYLECFADSPTGLYSIDKKQILDSINKWGFSDEEYAIYKNKKLTRNEYDDGAFERNGKLIKTKGNAELRVRYLSPYNLVICAKENPIISGNNDLEFENIMYGILNGDSKVDDLVTFVNQSYKKSQ